MRQTALVPYPICSCCVAKTLKSLMSVPSAIRPCTRLSRSMSRVLVYRVSCGVMIGRFLAEKNRRHWSAMASVRSSVDSIGPLTALGACLLHVLLSISMSRMDCKRRTLSTVLPHLNKYLPIINDCDACLCSCYCGTRRNVTCFL